MFSETSRIPTRAVAGWTAILAAREGAGAFWV
jgi:hypothetical protein